MNEHSDPKTKTQKLDTILFVLRGNDLDPRSRKNSLLGLVEKHEETLYGTDDNPGGMVKDHRQWKGWTLKITGGLGTILIFWKVLAAVGVFK